ncbi:sodium:proton exchanger [Actinomadura parmotrematis]|uniref:Sodium:proton exchanger n=1 Tax=Actinomadura parmotrematis TaxID=2864039 RepID=A0ABS7FP14_9ACTN|nr:sodium:proton exchanger [Actinomadura parmotrematis]MBW8482091.1 sodium:proton exchanger [Actinomadura parmotrematis]
MEITRTAVQVRVGLAVAVALPAVVLRLAGAHAAPAVGIPVYGVGVMAAAVLLMWAAETARADMSGALALALLALIAVLPEYAVDLYYAYAAGSKPEYAAYAAANMTGANRLLVGVGWTLVVLAFALGARRLRAGARDVRLDREHRIELGFLALAAVLGFLPALTGELGWYLPILLIALYAAYILRIARHGTRNDEALIGVAAWLTALGTPGRRIATWALFAAGAVVVFAAAEPFAESLVEAGEASGIDEFLLVQWLAPLASEAPELIVAVLFAWRLRDSDAIGALLSSKVNQWTLLIGTLPLAYRIGGGGWSLPLDDRQMEEVLLTAAQTVLGLAFLVDLYFERWEAAALFALFAVQFVLPGESARLVLSGVYLAVGFSVLIVKRADLARAMRAALP